MPKYIMSDGRAFTDYNQSCVLNDMLANKYNVKNSSHQYRYYLQKNAQQIMRDLANCEPKQDCAFCPVCKQALDYKPHSHTQQQ